MERKIFDETIRRYRSFDIYSPAANAAVEMHGRVWHDPEKTKPGIREIAQRNVVNDKLKQSIAERCGHRYVVFWDDECDQWFDAIRQMYGLEPITYEHAKNLAHTFDHRTEGI